MGRRGPPKAPDNVARLRGRKDYINENAARPQLLAVEPTIELSAEAQREWDRIVPDLVRQNVATGWDVEALVELCETVATMHEAMVHIRDDGAVIEVEKFDRAGNFVNVELKENPWSRVHRDALNAYMRLAGRFGLTPSDRAALDVTEANGRARQGEDLLTG